jgi:predicted outer membrane repeat protein
MGGVQIWKPTQYSCVTLLAMAHGRGRGADAAQMWHCRAVMLFVMQAVGSPLAPGRAPPLQVVASDTVFLQNAAVKGGGAVYAGYAALDLRSCALKNNSVDGLGGALWLEGALSYYRYGEDALGPPQTRRSQLTSCLLQGNTAVLGGALAVTRPLMYEYAEPIQALLQSSELVGNTVSGRGFARP